MVVDIGNGADAALGRELATAATTSLLVVRACPLVLPRWAELPVSPSGVIVVRHRRRTVTWQEIAEASGSTVVAELEVDPAVAAAVDAGLARRALPRRFLRAFWTVCGERDRARDPPVAGPHRRRRGTGCGGDRRAHPRPRPVASARRGDPVGVRDPGAPRRARPARAPPRRPGGHRRHGQRAGTEVWVERSGRLETPASGSPSVRSTIWSSASSPRSASAVDRTTPSSTPRLPDGRACPRRRAAARRRRPVRPHPAVRRGGAIPLTPSPSGGGRAARPGPSRRAATWSSAGRPGPGRRRCSTRWPASSPPSERIITVEDAAELRLAGRPRRAPRGPSGHGRRVGAVTIRELVRNALRMRPDRLVVGEVRGAEALDMVQAMNTGHDGSLSTCPRQQRGRRRAPARVDGAEGARRPAAARGAATSSASAIDLVVHSARATGGQRPWSSRSAEVHRPTTAAPSGWWRSGRPDPPRPGPPDAGRPPAPLTVGARRGAPRPGSGVLGPLAGRGAATDGRRIARLGARPRRLTPALARARALVRGWARTGGGQPPVRRSRSSARGPRSRRCTRCTRPRRGGRRRRRDRRRGRPPVRGSRGAGATPLARRAGPVGRRAIRTPRVALAADALALAADAGGSQARAIDARRRHAFASDGQLQREVRALGSGPASAAVLVRLPLRLLRWAWPPTAAPRLLPRGRRRLALSRCRARPRRARLRSGCCACSRTGR